MRWRSVAGLAAVLVVSAGTAGAQNLLTNGGAESGVTGWTPDAGVCGQTTGVSINTTLAHSGTNSFQIASTPGCYSWITQSVGLTTGHTYQVDFWAAIVGDYQPGSFEQNDVGYTFGTFGSKGASDLTAAQGWFHITHLVDAPTDTATIYFGGFNNNGTLLLDDLSVVDVTTTPEPASLALLGTGLVGLVPMLRRKRV